MDVEVRGRNQKLAQAADLSITIAVIATHTIVMTLELPEKKRV